MKLRHSRSLHLILFLTLFLQACESRRCCFSLKMTQTDGPLAVNKPEKHRCVFVGGLAVCCSYIPWVWVVFLW